MSNILYLTSNNLRLIFRKRTNIIVYIILPIVLISGLMIVTSSNSASRVQMGVVNLDGGRISADMLTFLEQTGKFDITSFNEDDFEAAVSSGKIDFAFIIPENFGQDVRNGKPQSLRIVSIKGEQATVFIEEYAAMHIENLLGIYSVSKGDAEVFEELYRSLVNGRAKLEVNLVSDSELNKEAAGMSWGLFIMLIMISSATTAILVLKDKRERTYYRITSAPVTSREYIVANVLSNFIISMIQLLSALLIIDKFVRIDTGIAPLQLFVILACFSGAAIGVGMLIMVFSDSTSTARMMITLIITPTCMLSGCFWPKSIMPGGLRLAANLLPQSWAMDAITAIQSGAGLNDIRFNLLIIVSFAVFFFLVAAYRLERSDKVENFI